MLATRALGKVASRAHHEHEQLTMELARTNVKLRHELVTDRNLMQGNQSAVSLLDWQAAQRNMTGQAHMHHVEEELVKEQGNYNY